MTKLRGAVRLPVYALTAVGLAFGYVGVAGLWAASWLNDRLSSWR